MSSEITPDRPEGVFLSVFPYPPGGGMYSTLLYRIERVNGSGSISTVTLTPEEAGAVLRFLESGLCENL